MSSSSKKESERDAHSSSTPKHASSRLNSTVVGGSSTGADVDPVDGAGSGFHGAVDLGATSTLLKAR